MQVEQLRALLAVVDHGTFEAAARTLHATSSAVSQRIKVLERDAGRVLVERTHVRPWAKGAARRPPAPRVGGRGSHGRPDVRNLGVTADPPGSQVPSSEGFVAAVRAGLGWAMVPQSQLGDDLETGRLVLLRRHAHRDVPLYWQVWTLGTPRMTRLGEAVHDAARRLRPARRGAGPPPVGAAD